MDQVTAQGEELSNDHVRFTIHKKPACRVEFAVSAAKQLVANAKNKALKFIAKEVTLPGFRKGRAPDAMIMKNFAKDVDKKWQEEIANISFQECEKIANIPLLSKDTKVSFQMKSHSDEGAELLLSFETEPQIPSVDPKLFSLAPIERPEVNDEKVAETIRQIKFFFAEWKKVESRGAQEGDFVILDVDVIENEPHKPLFSDTRFEVSSKYMAQWMKELVLGRNVNDTIEGVSRPDADAKDRENFVEQKVRVTVKSIDTATLPEITEDFLKKLGVSSEEELTSSIRKLLHKQADEHVKEATQEQVNHFLLEKHPFDLPTTLIEKEAQFRMRQLGQDPSFQKYWQDQSQEEKKKTLQSIYMQSEKAVRMFYMCRKIISDAKIDISPADLPQPALTPLEYLMDPDQMLHYHENAEVKHAEALSKLVLEKAAEYVVTNSQGS